MSTFEILFAVGILLFNLSMCLVEYESIIDIRSLAILFSLLFILYTVKDVENIKHASIFLIILDSIFIITLLRIKFHILSHDRRCK